MMRFLSATLIALASPAVLADWQDPLGTRALVAPSVTGVRPDVVRPCLAGDTKLLSLAAVVERALCNNPQTRAAWAQARASAAQVGVKQADFLPTLALSASADRSRTRGDLANDNTLRATLSYLLFDSGARDAAFESAHQSLVAAVSTHEAVIQAVFFNAAQAYYQSFATQATLEAAQQAEAAALESLKAARARVEAGSGTPADRLQAQTAWSQAVLNRIRAEGDVLTARGVLANVIGLDANVPLHVEPPENLTPSVEFDNDVDRLIDFAKRLRPDLVAAQARLNAARSNVDYARAVGSPTVNLNLSRSRADTSITAPQLGNALGVVVNIPIFTGFSQTYRVASARADLDNQIAARDQVERSVSLDVWRAYQALTTDTQSLRATTDLLASAEQAYKVALGRYQAGVGALLDLLNAQSALALARSQHVGARYSWNISRFSLGQAVGQLDFGMLDPAQTGTR